ncbi:arsenic resistance protein [Nocardiopsis sp. CNT312]|uniref:arsenic resistance protein n=1 Tax=Nocardiopsis sp. CNT312 TaxID=1137268 RepID=UPI00048D7654|nr:bile acid:sodium symporter [Nocardiopsis sp. CNT312]
MSQSPTAWLERHQVAVYVGALAAGAVAGLALPSTAPALERSVNPLLAALLYVTFLQVPAAELVRSLRPDRFLSAALLVNFAVVPLVVAAMLPFLPDDEAVRVGVLMVLLCPCVDYVIVFSGLAGGSSRRLLAATPLLLVAQMALLPVCLLLFTGPEPTDVVEAGPFIEAFTVLIAVPLALAWLTQFWAARSGTGLRAAEAAGTTMVPLMAATLFAVVASQIPGLDGTSVDVVRVVPFYVLFLVVMVGAGLALARLFRLDVPAGRAVVFTGATRNSLVVLPLALALPDALAATAAVAVVTQTLVEVIGMVVCVRTVPRLLPAAQPTAA